MQISVKKFVLEFLGALLLATAGSFCSVLFSDVISALKLNINLGGDKANVFSVLFIGMPIGSLLGILLVDRIFFKYQGYNLIGLCIGFVLCAFVGGVGSVMLLDEIGGSAVFFIPPLIIFLSFVGYYIPLLWARWGENGLDGMAGNRPRTKK